MSVLFIVSRYEVVSSLVILEKVQRKQRLTHRRIGVAMTEITCNEDLRIRLSVDVKKAFEQQFGSCKGGDFLFVFEGKRM